MAPVAELLVQAIVAVSGTAAAAAGVNGYFSNRTTRATVAKATEETGKSEAEVTGLGAGTAAAQVDTSLDMLREMRTDLTAARADATQLRVELAQLRGEIDYLRGLLTAAGVAIPLRPPDPA